MLQTRFHRFDRRIGVVVVGAICAVAILAASATAASASAPTTLHFYDKQVSSTFTDPSGHAIGDSNKPPPVGSAINVSSIGYAGNSGHHAAAPTASVHLACVVTTPPKALCFGQVAIGGSMLLANQFTVSLAGSSDPFAIIKVNGGTGKFANAHGTVTTTAAGKSSSNITITYST